MDKHLKALGVGFVTLAALPGSFIILGTLLGMMQYSLTSFLIQVIVILTLSYCVGFTIGKLTNKGG